MSRYNREKCSVADCHRFMVKSYKKGWNPYNYCRLHLNRYNAHGHIFNTRAARGEGRHKNMKGYIKINVDGVYRYEHIVLAEKALGRPLPKGAKVHHMNENTSDNKTPFNLIICPSEAYHKLLHQRMREYENRKNA